MPRTDRRLAAAAVAMDYAVTDAVVTVGLASAARARGGVMVATTAELHAIEGSGSPWPASVGEMAADTLPRIASKRGARGLTVRLLRRGPHAAMLWEVEAAPLPQPAPRPAVRPIATASAPIAAVQLRQVAAPAVVSQAEYERVRHMVAVEKNRQHWAKVDRDRAAERAKAHAENLAFLNAAKGGAAA